MTLIMIIMQKANIQLITALSLHDLDQAIRTSSVSVANLFQNDDDAKVLIPDWDADYFKELKSKIISENYTFIKESYNNTILYYLVHENKGSTQSFEHVLLYKITD